jgi:hypothetical protein
MKAANPIIMLTHNDVTVPDAIELFEQCKDIPITNWGIKDIGMNDEDIIKIGKLMKEAGKQSSYEIVDFSEASYERAAEIAVKGEYSYVACGHFNQKLSDTLAKYNIGYMPTLGILVHVPEPNGPVLLVSDKDEMLSTARYALAHGAIGLDCPVYRSTLYDGDSLLPWLRNELPDAFLCCAGSVNGYSRIRLVSETGFDAFTTGSALFDGIYVQNGGFRENLEALSNFMNTL